MRHTTLHARQVHVTLHFLYPQGADGTELRPAMFHFPRKTGTPRASRGRWSLPGAGAAGTARTRSSPPDGARCAAEGSRAGSRPLGHGANPLAGSVPPSRAAAGRKAQRDGSGRGAQRRRQGLPRSWGQKVPRTFLALALSSRLGCAARPTAAD